MYLKLYVFYLPLITPDVYGCPVVEAGRGWWYWTPTQLGPGTRARRCVKLTDGSHVYSTIPLNPRIPTTQYSFLLPTHIISIVLITLSPSHLSPSLPLSHPLTLSSIQVLLTDTVGFISKLPTDLIAAFRATLEEVGEPGQQHKDKGYFIVIAPL